MLNVHGAPKASTLEEYTPNLIAGFATAGGLIAFFVFACALYRFRYSNRHGNNKNNNKSASTTTNQRKCTYFSRYLLQFLILKF